MADNKSTADKAAEAYEALRAAEQTHRAMVDEMTGCGWNHKGHDGYDVQAHQNNAREAWEMVQKAAEAYEEITKGSGWAL